MTQAGRTDGPAAASTPFRADWLRAAPALVALLAVIVFAYRDTAAAMVGIWARSDTFAHAFLVPPIVAWLIWRRRKSLASLQPTPCPWVLLPMAAIGAVWLLGDLVAVNAVTQLAMTALVILAVPAVLGLRTARALSFPLAFLFFAVPIGEFMLPYLMSWTADFTVLALRASGIPVLREGQQLVIPSGRWAVVEACSGVRYLIASFMVGTLFAYLHYRSLRRRLLFIAVSFAVPIVANWVRAYLIVLIGHLSGNTIAVGVDHLIYGWLFFGLVMGVMFAIGLVWREPDAAEPAGALQRADRAPASRSSAFTWATAAAASMLALVPHAALDVIGDVPEGGPVRLASLGALPQGGSAQSPGKGAWKPAYQHPNAEAAFAYSAQDRPTVGLFVAYYRKQDYGRKLVASTNELVRSADSSWAQTGAAESETVATSSGQKVVVRSIGLRSVAPEMRPEQRLRAWQIYWVADKLTSSDLQAKLYAAVDRLLGRGDDSAVIVVYADDEPAGSARPVLQSFLRVNLDGIVEGLRAARDGARASALALK